MTHNQNSLEPGTAFWAVNAWGPHLWSRCVSRTAPRAVLVALAGYGAVAPYTGTCCSDAPHVANAASRCGCARPPADWDLTCVAQHTPCCGAEQCFTSAHF